jgi:hypothetical protein
MANVKISQLTAKGAHVETTDRIAIADFNGSTYDSKYITGAQLTPYKKYVALISQTGTAAPTATILENTIGTLTFVRNGVGTYEITSSSLFTNSKTFVYLTNPSSTATTIYVFNSSSILFETKDITSQTPFIPNVDEVLDNTSIEIRVYP